MKRRSGTNSASPREWSFFTDRDLGKTFPTALRQHGIDIHAYWEEFGEDPLPDEDWLSVVGERGWVVLTHDWRMRYAPLAKAMIRKHGIRYFVIKGQMTGDEYVDCFREAHDKILRFLNRHDPPFMAKIRRGNNVEMWLGSDDLSPHPP